MTKQASQNQNQTPDKTPEEKKASAPRYGKAAVLRAQTKLRRLRPARRTDCTLGEACDKLLPDILRAIAGGRTPEEIWEVLRDEISCERKAFTATLKKSLRKSLTNEAQAEFPQLWTAIIEGRGNEVINMTPLNTTKSVPALTSMQPASPSASSPASMPTATSSATSSPASPASA